MSTDRYDRTLRIVMWLDAFLSVALVLLSVVAAPVVATLGVPPVVRGAVWIGLLISGVLLAGFGAVTAVVLMLRMRTGRYGLPHHLRLPLPKPIRPTLVDISTR